MKSKFDSIVKLKKEYLDKAQRRFAKAATALSKVENRLSTMSQEILNLDAPLSGDMTTFRAFAAQKHIMRQSMVQVRHEMQEKLRDKNEAQTKLNEALLEFEKYKYLQTQEQQEQLKLLKKAEATYMDEIAIMGYNKSKGL